MSVVNVVLYCIVVANAVNAIDVPVDVVDANFVCDCSDMLLDVIGCACCFLFVFFCFVVFCCVDVVFVCFGVLFGVIVVRCEVAFCVFCLCCWLCCVVC